MMLRKVLTLMQMPMRMRTIGLLMKASGSLMTQNQPRIKIHTL